jgi:hypothetical protein
VPFERAIPEQLLTSGTAKLAPRFDRDPYATVILSAWTCTVRIARGIPVGRGFSPRDLGIFFAIRHWQPAGGDRLDDPTT